jgi:Zn-dependent protease
MQNLFIYQLFRDPLFFGRYIIIIVGSIVIHELAHGVAAISQGDDTPKTAGHITPNPIVHMGWTSIIFLCVSGMAWGLMPVTPSKFRHARWSDIAVSLAGPVSNLILGTVAVILAVVGARSGATMINEQFCMMAAQINFSLFALNMLPVPPLDGFHVYSQLFPKLKALATPEISMFLMFAIFSIPAVGLGIGVVSSTLVATIIAFLS